MLLSVAVETEVFERYSNCLPLKVMRCIVRAKENKKNFCFRVETSTNYAKIALVDIFPLSVLRS